MKRRILVLLAMGILLMGIAGSASATLITLTPSDMTGLRSSDGGASVLLLGFDAVKGGTEDRTISHFGINGLLDSFLSATLDIPILNRDPGGTPGTFEVYGFNGDGIVSIDEWSLGDLMHDFTDIDEVHPTLSLDVTSLVYNSISSGYDFVSFNFRAGSGSDRYGLSCYARLCEPTLNIDYSAPAALNTDNGSSAAPVPEPATMLLLGAGLVTLGASRRIRKRKK